jgi:hypothetical protein
VIGYPPSIITVLVIKNCVEDPPLIGNTVMGILLR